MKDKMRIKIMIRKDIIDPDCINSASLVGLIRGLAQGGKIQLTHYIEENTTDENYFFVEAIISKDRFAMVKGQAESYGLRVEKWNRYPSDNQ